MTPFALTVIVALVAGSEATARYPQSPLSETERLLDATISVMGIARNGPALRCIERNRRSIIENVQRAEREYGVAPGILLVTGALEGHCGCTRLTGRGSWGVALGHVDPEPAIAAAIALRASARVCGSYEAALSRFRCGLCRCGRLIGYRPEHSAWVIRRVYHRAGLDLPEDFPRPTGLRIRRAP